MKAKHRAYLRLNIMSLFFIAISFISVTLAWFAYSGMSSVSTEIGVKAWYIELEKDGQAVSNDIVISLSEIYPGMDSVNEIVNVKNLGDSDATVKYSIVSARVLGNSADNYVVDETTTGSDYVEDVLSHNYPFHINMNLTKNYVLSKGESSSFEVSISWPLDSDTDSLDSLWGTEAYKFQKDEESKKNADENYQVRPSIQIVISLTAEQYLTTDTSSDTHYNVGDTILFDVVNKKKCSEISSTCLKTYVMDTNNKLGDETVTLLPDPLNTYLRGDYSNYNSMLSTITNNWTVSTRPLLVDDILKIISTDVTNSFLIRNNISDSIIGSLKYANRINSELAKAVNYNGYYRFDDVKFGYLSVANCYWTSSQYDASRAFAVDRINESFSKVYGESKASSCNAIPIILANKSDL